MKPIITTDDTLRETTQHGSASFPLAYYLEDVWEADFQVFDPQIAWQKQILIILKEIYAVQELPEKRELQTLQLLLQLWDILYNHLDLTSNPSAVRRMDSKQARLQVMMQYIHDHYQEEITLEEIAKAASISKSSALHLFQSGIQIPPVAYLIQYRLMQAAELLYNTAKPVSVIAAETGFYKRRLFLP